MGWAQDLWRILETIVTLTKEVERVNNEIKELRRDLTLLTIEVTQLKGDLDHQETVTNLLLENSQKDIERVKESIVAKFDVLTTRLDAQLAEFENRLPRTQSPRKRHLLKGKSGK